MDAQIRLNPTDYMRHSAGGAIISSYYTVTFRLYYVCDRLW